MKKLPISKQEFKGLIESDSIYVDKTHYLIDLIDLNAPIFLSRPRRFGKSLMLNTFKELFGGNQSLFSDTYADKNWDFSKIHPVIKLDLSKVNGKTTQQINDKLLIILRTCAKQLNIDISDNHYVDMAFDQLIVEASNQGNVVILIDEYDTPILDNLTNPELPQIKDLLRGFYKTLKSNEEYIHFTFITGISKFTQVGVFSALNHIQDITLSNQFAGISGYSQQEIIDNFEPYLSKTKQALNLDDEAFWQQVSQFYNGYSWNGQDFVYNPVSLAKFLLNEGQFIPYWMETGSPAFIMQYALKNDFEPTALENALVAKSFLSKQEIDKANPQSFLTQAGYLTIKSQDEDSYTLSFPNNEVKQSFYELVLNARYKVEDQDILKCKKALQIALANHDVDQLINQLTIVLASIPYVHFDDNQNEHFYTAMLLMYLQAAGFNVSSEKLTNRGRLDLVIEYGSGDTLCHYLLELKTQSAQSQDKSLAQKALAQKALAQKALAQIEDKDYSVQYANSTLYAIGVVIDFAKRNISDYVIKKL